MRGNRWLAACFIVLAVPAVARQRSVPAATPVGAPVNCISLPIRESRVRDDRTIDFFARGKVYRNMLPYSCPGLGTERAFGYATSQSQLCSVDIIDVRQRAGGSLMRGASCGLGTFQPVTGIK